MCKIQEILKNKTMKIGIDARICDEDNYYGDYVSKLIEEFCATSEYEVIVYRTANLPHNRYNIFEELKTKKIFEKEKFALMIFFDYHIPHGYKWHFIVMIEGLKEVFFPKKKFFSRKVYQYKLQKAIEHSQKVLVMDTGSALELNERLNIVEDKIWKIHGFFPRYDRDSIQSLETDIKLKHNLRGNYLVYDSGNEVHNNFDRILKTLKKVKEQGIALYLMILCDETTKDIDIRNKALEYGISENIIFLGTPASELESSYYNQSSGVIFSSIYESFPFAFSKALSYNCKIFANDIPAIKDSMGKSISYLDPLSINNMSDTIISSLGNTQIPDYSEIFSRLNRTNSALELRNIIEEKK